MKFLTFGLNPESADWAMFTEVFMGRCSKDREK